MPTEPAWSDPLGALVAQIGRALFGQFFEALMSTIQELSAKVDSLRLDITDAAARSIAVSTALKDQIAALRALLDEAQVPPELMAKLDEMAITVRGIDPTDPTTIQTPGPVSNLAPEPTPEPESAPEHKPTSATQLTPEPASDIVS